MKILRLSALLLLMCVAPFARAQTFNNFLMMWDFSNADGTQARAFNDHCECGSVYIKNRVVYNVTSTNPNGTPIPALGGTYTIQAIVGPSFSYTFLASTWAYGQVLEIPIPCGKIFNEGPLNIRVYYTKSASEYLTYAIPGGNSRSLYLKTHSVSVEAGPNRTFCSGKPITMGGYPTGNAQSYSWSPAIPATAGALFGPVTNTYTVTGTSVFNTSSGNPISTITCKATDFMTITSNPAPIVGAPFIPALCTGASFPVINATSGLSNYSWTYNGGVLMLQNGSSLNTAPYGFGTYTYSASNSYGCYSTSLPITVSQSPSVAANLDPFFAISITNPGVYGLGTLDMTVSSTQSGEHRWGFCTSNASGAVLSPIYYTGWSTTPSYFYDGMATDVYFKMFHEYRKAPCNEVVSYERLLFVERRMPLAGGNNPQNTDFQIAPNPSTGIFNVNMAVASAQGKIYVLDMTGKRVYNTQLKENTYNYQIDLTAFAKGVYIINITTADKVESQKVVLE